MMILLTGGSACGKSTYAEELAVSHPGPRYYIASMRPYGEESLQRISRHRAMREKKGFITFERYTDLKGLMLPESNGVALLECLCNLTANELFDPGGAGAGTVDAVCEGICRLKDQCSLLIVVTNDVGSDVGSYDAGTMAYRQILGCINRRVAARSEKVMELVCGIPLPAKGDLP